MEMELDLYRRDGIFRLNNVFTPWEILAVQKEFAKVTTQHPDGVGIIREDGNSTVVRSIMGWQRGDGILSRFARDERIMRCVHAILGDQVVFHQTKCNPKAPDEMGEKWDPHRGDTFWCWKDGVPDPEGLMSVFIALTDQTEENGAVYAWPGSHEITLAQIRPHMLGLSEDQGFGKDTAANLSLQISPQRLEEIERTYRRVMLTGPAGTVWLLNAGLLHASQANRSTETRTLVANVYRRIDNRPQHPRTLQYLCEVSQQPIVSSPAANLLR